MAKRKRLWLARHFNNPDYGYVISNCEPERDGDFYRFGLNDFGEILSATKNDFEYLTGIHLDPGEIREVASITVKLVPVKKRKAVKR